MLEARTLSKWALPIRDFNSRACNAMSPQHQRCREVVALQTLLVKLRILGAQMFRVRASTVRISKTVEVKVEVLET